MLALRGPVVQSLYVQNEPFIYSVHCYISEIYYFIQCDVTLDGKGYYKDT